MKDLLVQDLSGRVEMLSDYEVTRKDTINVEKTIDVTVYRTKRNAHSFSLLGNECKLIYDNEPYVVHIFKQDTVGKSISCAITATHQVYDNLGFMHIYDTQSGTFKIKELLDFSLAGTGYTYSVSDDLINQSVEVDNFGDDDSLSLLQSICDKFSCEFEPTGTTIYIAKQIGRITDNQIRYLLNISDPEQSIDTSNLRTYIRGYGKQNDDGTYVTQAEYTSPLASVPGIGIRHADPVRDERFTIQADLLAYMKQQLTDSIDISISLTYVQLRELGIQDIRKGDYLWCIIDPFDVDVQIRVSEIEDYSDETKSPVLTLGSIKQKATDIINSLKKTSKVVGKVVDTATATIKTSALGTSVSAAVNNINNIVTGDGDVNLAKASGILTADHVSVGPATQFAQGYDPTQLNIPYYDVATEATDGLLSATDKTFIDGLQAQIDALVERVAAIENQLNGGE